MNLAYEERPRPPRSCTTCIFAHLWEEVEGYQRPVGFPKIDHYGRLGQCRRNAPTSSSGGFPSIFEGDWCGKYFFKKPSK